MNRLKELTFENHAKAERTEYARKLLKGMTPLEYYKYLRNQSLIYFILEYHAYDIMAEHPGLARSDKIKADLEELQKLFDVNAEHITICPVVNDYIEHVNTLDKEGLIAHIYVRHFGDMYGGQMIKKRNPGSGTMYDFENVETLKANIRSLLNDDMAEEANKCFEFAIRLFEELG